MDGGERPDALWEETEGGRVLRLNYGERYGAASVTVRASGGRPRREELSALLSAWGLELAEPEG